MYLVTNLGPVEVGNNMLMNFRCQNRVLRSPEVQQFAYINKLVRKTKREGPHL